MAPTLVNCSADESLGYVSYFRAVYDRQRSLGTLFTEIPDVVFQGYLNDVVARLGGMNPTPLHVENTPSIAGDGAAVIDVRTYPAGQDLTVGQLVHLMDPTVLLPSSFLGIPVSGIALASIERISATRAEGPDATSDRDASKQQREQQQTVESIWTRLGADVKIAVVVLVVLLVVVGLYFAARTVHEVKG